MMTSRSDLTKRIKILSAKDYIANCEQRRKNAARHTGRMQTLKELEPMTVQMIEEGTKQDAINYRGLAKVLRQDFGVRISITFNEGRIYAVRYE